MGQHPIDIFMVPRSVAIIGASRRTDKGSFNIIENMKASGFQGKIYPVNSFSGFTSSFMPIRREETPVGVICQSGLFFVGSSIFTGTKPAPWYEEGGGGSKGDLFSQPSTRGQAQSFAPNNNPKNHML